MMIKILNHIWVFLFGGCVHNYTNWEPTVLVRTYIRLKQDIEVPGQIRRCKKCNKEIIREVGMH